MPSQPLLRSLKTLMAIAFFNLWKLQWRSPIFQDFLPQTLQTTSLQLCLLPLLDPWLITWHLKENRPLKRSPGPESLLRSALNCWNICPSVGYLSTNLFLHITNILGDSAGLLIMVSLNWLSLLMPSLPLLRSLRTLMACEFFNLWDYRVCNKFSYTSKCLNETNLEECNFRDVTQPLFEAETTLLHQIFVYWLRDFKFSTCFFRIL